MSNDPDYLFALRLQQQLNAEATNEEAATVPQSKKMDQDKDYQLALKLQNEMNNGSDADADVSTESVQSLDMSNNNTTNKKGRITKRRNAITESYLDQTQNLVHPQWELIDPTPDIFAMFVRFDQKFFQKRLGAVSVEWSKRMYSCAGICYQRGNRYFKTIIIRLSEPLLKLRPRKDLVETLLHEMIHAYCFVQNIIEGNGGHGPNFKRIMETINKVAGTNITVYHSFHDEVNSYKTHIWRCNGVCQFHNPFQGWVKRTTNRAPGPNDQWWPKHQRECGGYFEKISEPEKPEKLIKPSVKSKPASKAKTQAKPNVKSSGADDIRNYFGKPNVSSVLPPTSYPGTSKNHFQGLQINDNNKKSKTSKPNQVFGFNDLRDSDDDDEGEGNVAAGKQQIHEMQGMGYSLSSGKDNTSLQSMSDANKRKHLRETWSNRYRTDSDKKPENAKKEMQLENKEQAKKRRRLSTASNDMVVWESYDEDVMICEEVIPTVTISDSEDDDAAVGSMPPPMADQTRRISSPPKSHGELSILIKREIMEEESNYGEDDIIMIDDEYDDNAEDLTAAVELADQSIMDDLFGEDTLLQEFQRENDLYPRGSRYLNDANNDITTCPICFDKMKRSEFANHLEGCSIIVRVAPPSMKSKANLPKSSTVTSAGNATKRNSKKSNQVGILKSAGYTDAEIAALNLSSSSESAGNVSDEVSLTPRQLRQRGLRKMTTQCPRCGQELAGHQLEAHRKICKRSKRS